MLVIIIIISISISSSRIIYTVHGAVKATVTNAPQSQLNK